MIDLSRLNQQQRLAVETTSGAVLVLAGAGSGKTSVLTHRIAYILDSGLAGPDNILAMTFTNKAAGEMKERIVKLLKDSNDLANLTLNWMGTFHSIGVKILKRYGNRIGIDRNFTIYDSADQLSVIKDCMEKLRISQKDFNPKAIQSYISSIKNENISPEDYVNFAQGYFQITVSEVYFEYEKLLRKNNAVDFDDLLILQIKLLENDEEIKKKLQEQFRYILIDEYQDTNPAQYKIISILAQGHKNICAVGDDDQSIYSFRGATIKNILNFERDYPNCEVIKLEQNYRSTKKILEASYQVISKNKNRKDKKLWTENTSGENITTYEARDEIDEANWILNQIESSEKDLDNIAILYRTNAQSRSLEEAFINRGIPYRLIGAFRFYERKEIKDIIAYLRFVFNLKDTQSLSRIINTPKRGIGEKSFNDFVADANANNLSPGEYLISDLQLNNSKLNDFRFLIKNILIKMEQLDIVSFIDFIIRTSGYYKMLDDDTAEGASRLENLKELMTVASKFSNEDKTIQALELFLDEVSLLEGAVNNKEASNAVTLMTIHSAKGLEFEYVFVVGMEENLFPHSNSMADQKELEEERRLAYVAITRAKEKLYLLYAKSRKYFGFTHQNPPSRFILDIEPKLIEKQQFANDPWQDDDDQTFQKSNFNNNTALDIGDKVRHEHFGTGVVKHLDDEMIVVDFGNGFGEKELMLEYARLFRV